MLETFVVVDGTDADLEDRFLYLNREMLALWEQDGRAAFVTADWQELEVEAEALRDLIPADERRELMDQVGAGFFCQPQSGVFRVTAVGVGR